MNAAAEESAAQADWKQIAGSLRQTLAKFAAEAEQLKSMDDVRQLVNACREAQWLEQAAAHFDHEIELNRGRIVFSD